MKVKELIEELSKLDGDLEAVVYCSISEDMDYIDTVSIETRDNRKEWSYCKGDHLFEDCDEDKLVVIG